MVPSLKRDVDTKELSIIDQAKRIVSELYSIITNDKYVPKKARWLGIQSILINAKSTFLSIAGANKIHVAIYNDYLDRRKLQQSALSSIEEVSKELNFIDIYNPNISKSRVSALSDEIKDLERRITNWMISDWKRYGKQVPDELKYKTDS